MKWPIMYLCAALVVGAAGAAKAVSEKEPGNYIDTLSVVTNGTPTAILILANPGPSTACLTNRILFDPTTAAGKTAYATLLAAKVAKQPVQIMYDREGTVCTLTTATLHP